MNKDMNSDHANGLMRASPPESPYDNNHQNGDCVMWSDMVWCVLHYGTLWYIMVHYGTLWLCQN